MFSATCLARSEGYYPSEITSAHYSDRSDVYMYGVVSMILLGLMICGINFTDCKCFI